MFRLITGPLCDKYVIKILWLIINLMVVSSNSVLLDCKFELQSKIFDLSGISLKPWTVSDIPDHSSSLVNVSLSVCNKTHPSPCGMVNFCVISKNGSQWSNLRSTHEQRGLSNDNIKISTILNRMNSRVSNVLNVEITLKCSKEVGEPQLVEFKEGHLILLWETAAACSIPIKDAYESCRLGQINIQSLRHMLYYSTKDDNGYEYYVNVCGGTVNSFCGINTNDDIAACSRLGNESKVLGSARKQHILKEDLRLEYRKEKKNGVKIELICNPKVPHGKLQFKTKTNITTIFELETSLACFEELHDCSTVDIKNFRYNLSSLRNKDYEVYDQRNRKFIVSVCGSVKNPNCPRGATVCLEHENSFTSLGSLLAGPKLSDQLSITSADGAYCHVSYHRYRSVILFKCAKTDSPPVLAKEPVNCTFIFEFNTQAACPFVFEEGNNCRVIDRSSGDDFDLKSLRKSSEDYVINGVNGDLFRVNVCGKLMKACNGSTNFGVCLINRKGEEHAIGGVAMSPQYKNGRVSFELSGDSCKSTNTPSRVFIIYMCSHEAEKHTEPEFFEKSENCSYFFIWRTSLVCGKYNIYDCQVSDDNGEVYDLRPLSLYDSDYIVWQNSTKVNRKFIINVCQPIMFGHGSRCLSTTGICMQDLSEPNYYESFSSLGEASGLKFDKEHKVLKVEYTNGRLCLNGADTSISSVIIFICDRKGKTSHPKLVKERGCRFEFEWRTELACSKTKEPSKEVNSCTIYDSNLGIRVDLSLFVGQEYVIRNAAGENFRFSICGSLKNTSFPGVGVCRETRFGCENLGMGNPYLHYNAGKLYLNYTDGVNCENGARKYTIIEFICDTKDSNHQVINSQNSCAFSIRWFTSLACMVPCSTDGPKSINLSILSSYENNYKVSANNADYFINVCKPLVPKQGLNCRRGSAVCKAIPEQDDKWSGEVSLGFPHYRPILINDKVVLNYSSNLQCSKITQRNLSSSIIFSCDPSVSFGVPVLSNLNFECHYEFLWKTSVICEDFMVQLQNFNAILNNSQSNMYIDLQPLCRVGKYEVKNYFIRMCDPFSMCQVEKVEEGMNISFGKAEYALFSYSENKTKLFISNGDDCAAVSSEKYHAIVNLLCAANGEDGLHILKESGCSVEFEWKSSAACAHFAAVAAGGETIKTSKSSVGTYGVVSGIVFAVIACFLLYCYKKSLITNYCRTNINRVFNRRTNGDLYTLRNPDSYDFDASSEELL